MVNIKCELLELCKGRKKRRNPPLTITNKKNIHPEETKPSIAQFECIPQQLIH